MAKKTQIPIHHAKTQKDFNRINNELSGRRFVAIDILKGSKVSNLPLGDKEPSSGIITDAAACIGSGAWSNGPLSKMAWSFDSRDNMSVVTVNDSDGKPLGLGYVKWGAGNNIPSTIPVLAQSSPYTAAPLRYIADLTAGLGPRLMYRFSDGTLVDYKDAGERLQNILAELRKQDKPDPDAIQSVSSDISEWKRTYYGYEKTDADGNVIESDPGVKAFLEDNNLNLHLSQCEQDDVMLDIYFPTVGLQRGRRGAWRPKIVSVDMLPAHSTRLERMNEYRHINHVYFSDQWRTVGAGGTTAIGVNDFKTVMYPAAMPQHLLSDLRYIVESNQRTRIKDRPTWVVCPTFYPSGQKPYYPQPAWWSIFTSKAFDFSSTILYDKAKQRENKTSWGKIFYISLDYLEQVFADEGYQGKPDEQRQFIEDLEHAMEDFLQNRENHGKMMRQWMWLGQDGKEHHNVEIVDIAESTKDEASAGKEELELSTSPIFLALQVDPRLVGVPMVAASNGGTALREMHLLKQQQLNVKQRLYLNFLQTIVRFNEWDSHAEWHIAQQTLTTLDNSKTGTVETISGEKA